MQLRALLLITLYYFIPAVASAIGFYHHNKKMHGSITVTIGFPWRDRCD